jgi:hypothetical protein
MKSITVYILVIATSFFLSLSCSNAQQTMTDKKVLVVYLSRTNNTKAIAEIIHNNVGGTLVGLELEKLIRKITDRRCNK